MSIQNLLYQRENVRLEGKKAENHLPKSLWETYSAFANTLGGDILLGVEENEKGELIPCGVSDANVLIKEIWSCVNNPQKISANILTEKDVIIHEIDNMEIIQIHVAVAGREVKPVYINHNQLSGTYRRNGDGDYHCTSLEINNMLRDQSEITQDFKVVPNYRLERVNLASLHAYRVLFDRKFHTHPWSQLDDEEFLYRLNGMDRDETNQYCLTEAGLFMFGNDYEIEKAFPNYFLDYRELLDDRIRWTNRIHSGTGLWSGNLFDFFYRVMPYLTQAFEEKFSLEHMIERNDENIAIQGVREAFINCITNANFYDSPGIVIYRYPNKIVFENPGILRLSVEQMICGGTSDPRNKAIMKMFSMIGLGERAGSGIPDIFSIWRKKHWKEPQFIQEFNHDRTILILEFALERVQRKKYISTSNTVNLLYEKIKIYLCENDLIRTKDVMTLFHIKEARARQILKEMCDCGMLEAKGSNRNRIYQLPPDEKK